MLDFSVIILTYNEELHIRRCIESVKGIAKEIFIVDSYSTDNTLEIAGELGIKVFQNKWENNYAKQFNWGLNHLPVKTKWVLRLDADEYLLPELIEELREKLDKVDENVSGIVFKRRLIFLDKWMKKGVYPVKLLRLFKYGKGNCEQRLMDEHIQLTEGDALEFEHDFVDHNLNDISWFCNKHVNYAIREAVDMLDIEFDILGNSAEDVNRELGLQAKSKRNKKHQYAKQPLFLRSFAYFIYRYIFKLGFVEGVEGFLWHFLQGWWYRTLVDVKILEVEKACGKDPEKILNYIKKKYDIAL